MSRIAKQFTDKHDFDKHFVKVVLARALTEEKVGLCSIRAQRS